MENPRLTSHRRGATQPKLEVISYTPNKLGCTLSKPKVGHPSLKSDNVSLMSENPLFIEATQV